MELVNLRLSTCGGIIDGMSWESSAEYYRLINENIKVRLGSTHSAELAMDSVDFHLAAQLELEEHGPNWRYF